STAARRARAVRTGTTGRAPGPAKPSRPRRGRRDVPESHRPAGPASAGRHLNPGNSAELCGRLTLALRSVLALREDGDAQRLVADRDRAAERVLEGDDQREVERHHD